MRAISRFTAAALAAALSIAVWSSVALGAATGWDVVDVTVHDEQGRGIMLVSGELPKTATLPAEVELSVPAGAEFQWAGEILGGAPEQDPTVQYTVEKRDGVDVYKFTLTKSRIGQLEVLPQGLVTSVPTGLRSNLTWTASTSANELRLNYRIPQAAKVLEAAAGASVSPGPTGYSYYSKTVKDLKPGQTESLQFTYSAVAATPPTAPATTGTGSDNLVLGLVLVLAAGAFVLLLMNVNKKMQAKSAGEAVAVTTADASVTKTKAASTKSTSAKKFAEPEAPESIPAGKKQTLVLGIVVAVLGVGAVIAFANGGKATVQGDQISLEIAQVDACTVGNIPLVTPAGGDLGRDADSILKRLKSVSGVGSATIYISRAIIEVNYCESLSSEAKIREALAPSGYVSAVVPAAATSAPATPLAQ